MPVNGWTPRAHKVDQLTAIDGGERGAVRRLRKKWRATDRAESAHGRINSTGHKLQRPREELVREWGGHTIGGVRLTNVFLDDRNAPADAKGPRRDLQTGSRLLTLVFIQINFTHDLVHNRGGKSLRD